ncbi:molybdenum cofactor guanylyltransferase [Terrisporobacter vanillatitrophus]|uniref:molybdenum cofactor guanylyltransferase n=1 Tax=Terrisporobacter vanillatitrophus TaxID=3058402 RepID=UPI00336633C4
MDIGALILMGGKNSRMGGNIKGFLKINDVTFLEKIISGLEDFSNVYLSVNKKFSSQEIKAFEDMGLTVIVDMYDDIGPMGGMYSSLKNCKEDYLFITACDMPYINKDLINELKANVKENTDVVLFSKNKLLYPLGAIYSKSLIPFMEELIIKEEYKPLKLIRNSNFIELPLENTNLSDEAFRNINTPEEYYELIKYYNK